MPENFADIVISGAGPNGLMLACELALAGLRPIVLDALPEPSPEPKANGLVGQVARVLDLRGLYDTFSGVPGPPTPVNRYIFGAMPLDLTAVQPNPVNLIMRPQPQMVRLLTDHAIGLGVDLRWGHALTEIDSGDGEVTVSVSGPDEDYRLRTRFLVGADGGKSLVRKRIGIDFPGVTATGHVSRVGHVTVPDGYRTGDGGIDIPGVGRFGLGHHRLERGMFVYAEIQPGNPMVGAVEFDGGDAFGDDTPLTIDELRASVERVLGVPLALTAPTGPGPHALRRTVGQHTRVAERYREGNILLLGDAAHVHSAMGGPGLNLGLQDTVNLGWKLAAEIHGWAPRACWTPTNPSATRPPNASSCTHCRSRPSSPPARMSPNCANCSANCWTSRSSRPTSQTCWRAPTFATTPEIPTRSPATWPPRCRSKPPAAQPVSRNC